MLNNFKDIEYCTFFVYIHDQIKKMNLKHNVLLLHTTTAVEGVPRLQFKFLLDFSWLLKHISKPILRNEEVRKRFILCQCNMKNMPSQINSSQSFIYQLSLGCSHPISYFLKIYIHYLYLLEIFHVIHSYQYYPLLCHFSYSYTTICIRIKKTNSVCWQHTPRVNGEIPDVNDATVDHERLSER